MKRRNPGPLNLPAGAVAMSVRRYYALSASIADRSKCAALSGRLFSIVSLLLLAGVTFTPCLPAAAAEPIQPPTAEAPPPPPLPARPTEPASEPESGLEPEVTITTHGETTHEEYRVNGRLYMIKVIPKHGKPYYLIDDRGDGEFRRSDIEARMAIPNWVIKSW